MRKFLIAAFLFFWPVSAVAGTSAEIIYHPASYSDVLEMHFSESYSLMLTTDTTNSTQAPAMEVSLQCTSEEQDYYAELEFEIWHPEDIPVQTVLSMFGPFEKEHHPARLTGSDLDISSSWRWFYFERDNKTDPWRLLGDLNDDPATLVRISNALKGSWLRIEVFGFIYDFDLSSEGSIITGFHQKCAIIHGS